MSCNNVQILNFNHNIVEVGSDNKLIITDNVKCNSITIPQPVTNILQINSPGPQGPAGQSGGDTSGFVTTSSFNAYTGSSTSQFAGTSSFALTASYALFAANGGGSSVDTGSFVTTSSFNTFTSSFNTFTSSYNTGSFSGSFTGSLQGTASWAHSSSVAISSSYATTASFALTASNAQNAQDILIYVKNVSGAQINKGKVVRISGATGDNALIATASYENDNNSANTLGITNQNIANDSFGYVITEGTLIGIDTNAFTAGQLLFLGATGSIIGTAPVAPLHGVRLGQVLRVQQNNGSMYVRIDNGYEIGELHDVVDTTTTSSYGDLLVKSGSVWTNTKNLSGSYTITGSLTISGSSTFTNIGPTIFSGSVISTIGFTGLFSGSFTGSLQGTASQAISASISISSSFASNSNFATSASYADNGSETLQEIINNSVVSNEIIGTIGSDNAFIIRDQDGNNGLYIYGNDIASDKSVWIGASGTSTLFPSPAIGYTTGDGLQIRGLQSVPSSSFILAYDGTSTQGVISYISASRITFPYTGNAVITGSLLVSGSSGGFGGITGSLQGTASYALTASYAMNAGTTIDTGSFVTTSSFNTFTSSFNTFTSSYNTGSFSGSFTGSLQGTATTASYVTASNVVGTVASASYALTASSVVGATPTEVGYLSGVINPIQTQLNSKVYSIFFFSNAWTIVAGQSTYIANFPRAPATSANISRVYIPKAGIITDALFSIYSAGVTGSNNAITASLVHNNNITHLIEQNAIASQFRTFTNNSLSIQVAVGDYIEMKMQVATPYTTVPTNNFPTANILIRTT